MNAGKHNAAPRILVLGSVNLDLVANVERLPVPGETISDAVLYRFPGGKGANQALAAKRLGADVALCARTGDDPFAAEALALLVAGGVDLTCCRRDPEMPTGIALITVAACGENQIVVAPGANRTLTPDKLYLPGADALICQLEVPLETIEAAATRFDGLFCVNAAPARRLPDTVLQRADLLVMNETEAEAMGDQVAICGGLIALTLGSRGAELRQAGAVLATAAPPSVAVLDTVGAGDAFTAALTVALLEGQSHQDALRFACAAGALATTRRGAQPSLPLRSELSGLTD